MADALVATDFNLATDISLNLAAEVTLYLPGSFNDVTQRRQLIVVEVVGAQVGRNAGLFQQFLGTGRPDAVDVGESNLHALVAREVNTS